MTVWHVDWEYLFIFQKKKKNCLEISRSNFPPNICTCIQTVDMHREKVARREIGAFTVAKRVPRSHKIVPPAKNKEAKIKYSRAPISFSSLDSVGHGIKVSTHIISWSGYKAWLALQIVEPKVCIEALECHTMSYLATVLSPLNTHALFKHSVQLDWIYLPLFSQKLHASCLLYLCNVLTS